MKNLRQYIRNILEEAKYHQDHLDQLVHNRENARYSPQGTSHREYEKEVMAARRRMEQDLEDKHKSTWPTDEEIDESFDLRRMVKKFWNENADHEFWQDPNQVVAVHDLSYYAEFTEKDDEKFSQDADLAKIDQDLKIESFLKKYPPGKRQKDEMSTYGFTSLQEFLDRDSDNKRISLGIILNPRRVTFAARNDAYTESRSQAAEKDFKRHASSGLPKRPSIDKYFRGKGVIFDKSDLGRGKIGELVVDNWSYNTLVINTGYNKYFSVNTVKAMVKLAKSYGLRVIDGRHGEEL